VSTQQISHVSVMGNTIEKSIFKLGNAKTTLNYKDAISELTYTRGTYKKEISEAKDDLENAYNMARSKAANKNKGLVSEIAFNKPTANLFRFFKHHVTETHEYVFFIKVCLDIEEYRHATDLLAAAQKYTVHNPHYVMKKDRDEAFEELSDNRQAFLTSKYVKIIDLMKHEFIMLKESKELYMPISDEHSEKDAQDFVIAKRILQEYWDKYAKKIWLEDMTFALDKQPKIVSYDPDVPSFNYFDLDQIKEDECPAAKKWIGHMIPKSLQGAVMSEMYAPFDPDNNSRKISFFYDKGFSGKTTFMLFLRSLYGEENCVTLDRADLKSDFVTENLYGKSVLFIDDPQDPFIIKSPLIKKVTAGSLLRINGKNKAPFSAYVKLKVFIFSNDLPQINTQNPNEVTRLLFVPLNKPDDEYLSTYCYTDDDGKPIYDIYGNPSFKGSRFKKQLEEEAGGFLYELRKAYQLYNPEGNEPMLTSQAVSYMYRDCVSQEQSEFEEYVHRNIKKDPKKRLKYSDLVKDYEEYVRSKGLRLNQYDYSKLANHLIQKYKLSSSLSAKDRNRSKKYLWGITVTSQDDRSTYDNEERENDLGEYSTEDTIIGVNIDKEKGYIATSKKFFTRLQEEDIEFKKQFKQKQIEITPDRPKIESKPKKELFDDDNKDDDEDETLNRSRNKKRK
jgi:phage/plasmid-associated DNA primase